MHKRKCRHGIDDVKVKGVLLFAWASSEILVRLQILLVVANNGVRRADATAFCRLHANSARGHETRSVLKPDAFQTHGKACDAN
jgi:hypothetical protein